MPKTIDYSGLTFRQDCFVDGAAWTAFAEDTFGMPFGWFDADATLVANLAAFAMPLMINGRIVRAAAFQSGAGLARARNVS